MRGKFVLDSVSIWYHLTEYLMPRLCGFASALLVTVIPVFAQPPAETPVRLMVQTGASANVIALAFSPDGHFILTGGGDHEASLWRVDGGKQIASLRGHTDAIVTVAFLPGGTRAVTGSMDKTARIWDLRTQTELRQLVHPSAVSSISVSPRDGSIATAAANTVFLWDSNSGAQIRTFEGHTAAVRAVAFSPDGKLLASAGSDKTVRLWDIDSGREIRDFTGHDSQVNTVAFSPDGATLATGSGPFVSGATGADARTRFDQAVQAEHTIRLWTVATAAEIRRIDAPGAIWSVSFSPDGRLLGSGGGTFAYSSLCAGCESRIFEIASGRENARIAASRVFNGQFPVESVTFSPDGRLFARNDYDEVVIISASGALGVRLRGYPAHISDFAFSPNFRFVYTGARAWNLDTGRIQNLGTALTTSNFQNLRFFDRNKNSLSLTLVNRQSEAFGAFSPDGTTLATSSPEQVRFIDLNTSTQIRQFANMGYVTLTFSPDGRSLLAAKLSQPFCLLDARTGAEIRCLSARFFPPHNPAFFSPSGEAILTADLTQAITHVWETATGKELRSFPIASDAIAFVSADEFAVCDARKGNTYFWNWRTGEQLRVLQTGFASSLAVSKDGRWMALGPQKFGLAKSLHVWDLATGKEVWSAPDWSAEFLSFTPDNRFLFTSGSPGTTHLYEAATGKPVCSFVAFVDGSWAVTDPEGRYDAANPDGAIGLHWVAGDEVIELGQLKQRFYTPGLLARILKGERLPEVAGIQTIKLFPAVDAQPLAPGASRLQVKLANRGGGIGRVVVKVNGKELSADARGPSIDPQAASAEFFVDLAGATLAADGKNSVEIIAYDAAGLLSSRGVRVQWTTPPAAAKPQRLFALVAGVSEYDNPALNLKYAAKDAADFANALRLGANRLFGADQVSLHLLSTDPSPGAHLPTKDQFRRTIDAIVREAQSQDVFVLYLAGHGVSRRGTADLYYFLTRAARSTELPANDAAMLDQATISSEELKEWCKRIPALKQVIILDTCAAGAANQELLKLADRRDLSPDQIRALELLKDSTGSHVLMGSAADAVSYEAGRYGQGLLTYALLEGIKGAALDDGQRVDIRRLFDFAQRQVELLAAGIGGIQRPLISSPQGQTFPIGLLTDEDKRAIPLSAPKPQLLRASCLNADDADPQGLTTRVRALLRDAAEPVTRDRPAQEPLIVYLDAVVDDLPSALIPRIRYQLQSGTVEARIRLFRDNQPVSDDRVTVSADPVAAARRIADAIIQAATRLGSQ